ncbi:hypothetical protein COLO4_24870 [Corchorus olitorius]|uniref:Uncharacterized protein n=1 Tax=Corchorus olitorius TaxID=93759 RepID=A0A1R3I676_9ROSI|nr:hypothetical protein COLO4_24870 [Corchorus olitorius]
MARESEQFSSGISATKEEALVAVGMEAMFMEDVFTSIEGAVETGDAATSGLNIGTDDEE